MITRRLLNPLKNRPFLRNVAVMLTGAAGGQIVSLLASPLLTRLYSPEQFGVLSVYLAVIGLVAEVSLLRYEMAIPLVNSDLEAINLAAVCGVALVFTTTLASLGTPILVNQFAGSLKFDVHEASLFRWLVPTGLFCLGAYFIALYLATRSGAFAAIAQNRFKQGIFGSISQVGLALFGFGAWGLLIGSVIGQSAGTVGLMRTSVGPLRAFTKVLSWKRMLTLAKRYARFPLISSWSALIEAGAGNQILYLLIAIHFSPIVAGYILLVERVVSRPLVITGTSVLQVFIGEAGQMVTANPDNLMPRFFQIIGYQSLIAVLWIGSVNIAAPLLFPIVFGGNWGDSVVYLQAMSVGYFAVAVVGSVSHTLLILQRQTLAAAWQISRLVLVSVVLIAGVHLQLQAVHLVLCYSIAQAICCAFLLLLMVGALRRTRGSRGPAFTLV